MRWCRSLKNGYKNSPTEIADGLGCDRPIQSFKDDRDQIVAFGTFDLLKGLDVGVFRTVHNGENFGDEMIFITGPLARGAIVKRLHRDNSLFFKECCLEQIGCELQNFTGYPSGFRDFGGIVHTRIVRD